MRCTACSVGNDAEHIHPILKVYTCGACSAELQKPFNVSENGQNESRCIWCGEGDGSLLLMCDTCPYSFCQDCVTRNFGKVEAAVAHKAAWWSCYLCRADTDGSLLARIQVDETVPMINIERAYGVVRPPPATGEDTISDALRGALTGSEFRLVSLFCDRGLYQQIGVTDFLTARDIQLLKVLSKPLRAALQSLILCPGLFKTPFGEENGCRLHPHQWASLAYMKAIEEKNQAFGAVRGGVLADAPGLGKTVTAIALIASTR
jgi:hypothetical protein